MDTINNLSKSRIFLILVYTSIVFSTLIVFFTTTPYMGIASIAYALLCIGLLARHNRKAHIVLMNTGILIDISLVLILEIQRSAIATSFSGKLNLFQMGHIVCSLSAVLFYLPAFIFGLGRLKQKSWASRGKHLFFGKLAFILRTLGFILMFSLLNFIKQKSL